MKDYIKERALELSSYIIENNATVRKTAEVFKVSKSTVHKDVSERLYYIDRELYEKVVPILAENKAQRHIRGGIATKNKYMQKGM